jgi:hypothetical protein
MHTFSKRLTNALWISALLACTAPPSAADGGAVPDAPMAAVDAAPDARPPMPDAYIAADDAGPRPWTVLDCERARDEGVSGQRCEIGGACYLVDPATFSDWDIVECHHARLSLSRMHQLCRAEGASPPIEPWAAADCARALEEGESGDACESSDFPGCARRTPDPACVRVATYARVGLELREICAHGSVVPSGRDVVWRACPLSSEPGAELRPWIGDECEGEWQCALPDTAVRTSSVNEHVALFCVDGHVRIVGAEAPDAPRGCASEAS